MLVPYDPYLETIWFYYFLLISPSSSEFLRQCVEADAVFLSNLEGLPWGPWWNISYPWDGSIPALWSRTVAELFLGWFLDYICLHPEGSHLLSAYGSCSNEYTVSTCLARSDNDKFNPTVWTVTFIWVKVAKCPFKFCTVRTCSLVSKSAVLVDVIGKSTCLKGLMGYEVFKELFCIMIVYTQVW